MPQLQPGDFAPQLIWLAIIFTLFYIALSRLALPRIAKVLADRKTKLGGDLSAAREAQASADQEAQRYETELANAKAKGNGTIRSAREKLEAELGEKRRVLETELAAKAAETETKVKAVLEKASGQMEAMTADVVSDIVKELAGIDVTENEVRDALRQRSKE
ncbi:F0F1 ATP synthase subunit B' [Rhodomicrobium sp. Az07]|uniref:F0F1 ATP synthase subunit B family protein n=1 Tax=Rhodomicrobium sp. Az07 TaxID=2839034 RepID=UPI001BEC5453|nr:F0F1 ATP synthase subunit B' [Rhodomicrobium sp. Az07]MBT3071789.1 F0F1 ATP synthase subunit B' [Rhodomicrobium sp. Az07]